MIRVICVLLVLFTSHAAFCGRNGVPYVAPTGSVSIPTSSQTGPFPKSIAANNWTGFTGPAGSVFQSTNWTTPSTNINYLQANDYHVFVAQTTATPRDVEVTTYVRNGTIFLRLFNGTAIFCTHNGDAGTGEFKFGVVVGLPGNVVLNSNDALTGSYHTLYDNTNMGGTVPGYDQTNTAGASLTCGVSGLNIYAKFNGVTFASVLSNYDVVPGPVALWANSGFGFRDVTVTYLSTAPLSSMPAVSRWSPVDWGLKSGSTTGSITSGTNTLTLAASLGVSIGDSLIVAVGGESGAGARGTVGVGGNSPTLSFANATEMNADTTEVNLTNGWTRDNGEGFTSFSGVWTRSGFYYNEFTAPRALLANVTAVSNGGLTLTLDTNPSFSGSISGTTLTVSGSVTGGNITAGQLLSGGGGGGVAAFTHIVGGSGTTWTVDKSQTVSSGSMTATGVIATATNANVYVNSYAPINTVLNPAAVLPALPYQIVDIPAGTYAIAPPMGVSYTPSMALGKTGWRIFGQGGTATVLMSPLGATSTSLKIDQSSFTEVANLGIVGNNAANGFGMSWAANTLIDWPRGIIATGAFASAFHDLAITNVFAGSINTSFSDNATVYNCAIVQQFVPPNGDIEPWYLQVADSTGGGIHDCTFTAPLLTTGLEMFRSNAITFKNITLNNGVLSCNTCGGGFLIEDVNLNVSSLAGVGNTYLATGPLISFNGNIGTNPRMSEGGTINRLTSIQQGYYDNSNNVMITMSIETNNSNITIQGTYPAANGKGCIQKPDWFSGTNAFLGMGVRSDATGTVVSGMRVIGHADYAASHSDVYAEGGSLTSTNNVMDSSVLGAGSKTETGTQSNATWNAANPGHPGC